MKKTTLMKLFRMAAVALCLSSTLGGCGSYQKPGGTAAEWEQVKAGCMMEAHQQVGARPQVAFTAPTRTSEYECYGRRKVRCEPVSRITPPMPVVVDANEPLRAQVTKGCYARHGWTLTP